MQKININLTPPVYSLLPLIYQSNPEAISSIAVRSSLELDTDQDDILDETIK